VPCVSLPGAVALVFEVGSIAFSTSKSIESPALSHVILRSGLLL
jgi:hypothetical protein